MATIEEQEQEQEQERITASSTKKEEGSIITTWGTGTGKTTMVLHVRKSYYKKLGWEIGDFVYMVPDFENQTLTIKKVDMEKLKKYEEMEQNHSHLVYPNNKKSSNHQPPQPPQPPS